MGAIRYFKALRQQQRRCFHFTDIIFGLKHLLSWAILLSLHRKQNPDFLQCRYSVDNAQLPGMETVWEPCNWIYYKAKLEGQLEGKYIVVSLRQIYSFSASQGIRPLNSDGKEKKGYHQLLHSDHEFKKITVRFVKAMSLLLKSKRPCPMLRQRKIKMLAIAQMHII